MIGVTTRFQVNILNFCLQINTLMILITHFQFKVLSLETCFETCTEKKMSLKKHNKVFQNTFY